MKTKFLENVSTHPLVYWLSTEDVQNIAKEKIERELTDEEIKKLIEPICENINWAEAVGIAIDQKIKSSKTTFH